MWKKIKAFFEKTWAWVEELWNRHDEILEEMVAAVVPMVISVAFRNDLSGEEKKKAIIDAIVDNAELVTDQISHSILNEAIEIAANRYNIQIGKLTLDKMETARTAALKASRDFVNNQLKIAGDEAETAGIILNEDVLEEPGIDVVAGGEEPANVVAGDVA